MSPARVFSPDKPERINISHTSPDVPVQQVLDKLDREILVVDALGDDGVQGVIDALARRQPAPPPFSLDLIAHARRGVLRLGNWSIDANATTTALHAACEAVLAELPLAAIRLLGCNTAISREGQAAMRNLHQLFTVPIVGTKVPISARDFGSTGFLADAILTDQDHLPPPSGPTLQSAGGWLGRFERLVGETLAAVLPRLRREPRADVFRDWDRAPPSLRWPVRQLTSAQLNELFRHVSPELVHAPGLLALPDLELVVPVDEDAGAPRYHRITVLLDGYWLRLYPRGLPDGVVVSTDADQPLFEIFNQGRELLRTQDEQ
jgi:hypothetical protein